MQTVYIDQLLKTYQITYYNLASIFIVKESCLTPTNDDFISNYKDVSAYKQFIKKFYG